jgi:hypothetical protein
MESIWKSPALACPVVKVKVHLLSAILAYLSVTFIEMKYLAKLGYVNENASPEVTINHASLLQSLIFKQIVLLVIFPKLTSLKIANFSKVSDNSIGLSQFFTTIVPQTPIHLYHL